MKGMKIVTISVCFLAVGWIGTAQAVKEKAAVVDPVAARKEAEAQARAKLNAKQWVIEVMTPSAKKAKNENDTLTFSEGRITSANLSEKGYPTSNYTLTLREDEVIIWETMQTSENGDVAFWRGELQGENMTGMVSLHPAKGQAQDCYFKTVTGEAAAAAIEEPQAPKEEPKKEAEKAQPKKKSKKKR